LSAFIAAIVAIVLTVAGPSPGQTPAVVVPDPAAMEAELAAKIAASPRTLPLYYQLVKLLENRGAYPEAEATLMRARRAAPSSKEAAVALAHFYNRIGEFEKMMAAFEAAAEIDPRNPQSHVVIAAFYLAKVSQNKSQDLAQQLAYITAGVSAANRALAIDTDHAQALSDKSFLLRERAALETDPVKQQLVAEADALANRAVALFDRAAAIDRMRSGGQRAPNAPASPTPVRAAGVAGALAPVRVGGTISTPTKVRDVPPVYPPIAQSGRLSGIIILEVTIAADGRVSDGKVLRSIPLLDQAALDAVRQWEYTPTLVNGVPVPVMMTVTVNFSPPLPPPRPRTAPRLPPLLYPYPGPTPTRASNGNCVPPQTGSASVAP
jgi:TonB family protein